METVEHDRRHRVLLLKRALREVNNQISLLSHRVSARAAVKDIDLDTLDYLSQHGALTATALARGIGLHPATMTGVLDRLEKSGWILRSPVPSDRRATHVSIDPKRNADLVELYAGMDSAMDGVLAPFTDDELETITRFLTLTAEAGRSSTEELDA
jgi:DNA-binding MarR family transcriptional regulator